MGSRRTSVVVTSAVALAVAAPAVADAAFPGANGKLVFTDVEPPCQPGGACDEADLYTANPDGSTRVRLLQAAGYETEPQWSPDGSKVAYAAPRGGNYDIYVVPADGSSGEDRVTTDPARDGAPAWTPDGQRIVFTSNRSGTYDLWAVNADGTGVAQLTSGPADDFSPAVSPDGTGVAFVSDRDRSPPPCRFFCTVYTIYLMDIDGSNVTRIPIDDGPECFFSTSEMSPDWSPAGDRLVFSWHPSGDCSQELDVLPGRIETIRPDGADQRVIVEDLGDHSFPAWSPDGTRIVYSYLDGWELRSVDSGTGANLDVVTTGDMPGWQPIVNRPPQCAGITASQAELRPADRRFRPVALAGGSDPDGDAMTLEITKVTQDEPVKGRGDGTAPDARPGSGPADVRLRAERSPRGDGRVYRLIVQASDGRGGTCEAEAVVEVRRHKKRAAVDSAPPSFDSFGE